jgi:hypothetical protein
METMMGDPNDWLMSIDMDSNKPMLWVGSWPSLAKGKPGLVRFSVDYHIPWYRRLWFRLVLGFRFERVDNGEE